MSLMECHESFDGDKADVCFTTLVTVAARLQVNRTVDAGIGATIVKVAGNPGCVKVDVEGTKPFLVAFLFCNQLFERTIRMSTKACADVNDDELDPRTVLYCIFDCSSTSGNVGVEAGKVLPDQ